MASVREACTHVVGAYAVSYTHLDVYKRQAFDYARYDTHVRYLLERVRTGEPLNTCLLYTSRCV